MTVDKNTATDTSPASGPDRRWWALAGVALAVSLVIMDATVVNVALPVMIRDLGLTASEAEWMNAIYSLMFAALLLTAGRVGDLWGRRRLLLVGMVVFLVASVVAGSVSDGGALIGARLGQGIGAALVLPTTLSTLNAVFVGRQRAIAFAVWGSTIGGMAAVGPLVGGWLTTDVTWRWAFWINVPVGLVVIAVALYAVPETRDDSGPRRLDGVGIAFSLVGMGSLVFALIEGLRYGWWRQETGAISPVPVAFVLGLVLMTVFVVTQLRRARAGKVTLVDLGLLQHRSFRYGSIAALVVALGELGLLFALPLLLQNALGYSALGTGGLIVVLALGTFLVSGATPQLTRRWGGRAVVRTGLALEAVAVGGISLTLTAHVSGAVIAAWLFLYGLGVGMATAQLTSVILADVPVAESGQASGLQSTIRQIGSALGVAILGALLITSLGHQTRASLVDLGVPAAQSEQIASTVRHSAGGAIPALEADPSTRQSGAAARDALISASKITTGSAAAVIALGLAATLALPPTPPEAGTTRRRRGAAARTD